MVDLQFFPSVGQRQLAELLETAPSELVTGFSFVPDVAIASVSEPGAARAGDVCFVSKQKYVDSLSGSAASLALVSKDVTVPADFAGHVLVCDRPHHLFVWLSEQLHPESLHRLANGHSHKDLPEPIFEADCCVDKTASIARGVEIGAGTWIGPFVVIGPNVKIGRNCRIEAHAVIECAYVGDKVTIRSGAKVGCVGFGWLDHAGVNTPVPQLGRAILQAGSEVGVNSLIDRGALGDTEIAENAKIGNLCQIGHNSRVGRNTMITPTCGLAGGTIVGESVIFAAGARSSGHLTVGDRTFVHAGAAVTKDWPADSRIIGEPARPTGEFWREMAALRRLSKGDKK